MSARRLYSPFGAALLLLATAGCALSNIPTKPDAQYVWRCRLAGGSACTQEQIRCWGVREQYWVDEARCRAFEKPENLTVNQSYPRVHRSALFPYSPR